MAITITAIKETHVKSMMPENLWWSVFAKTVDAFYRGF